MLRLFGLGKKLDIIKKEEKSKYHSTHLIRLPHQSLRS